MRLDTVVNKVYKFEELTEEVKEKVISNWYEHEDYPMLEEDLTEIMHDELKKHHIKIEGKADVNYSLSYSQGDGACFMGDFRWKNYIIKITKNNGCRYSHSNSTDIEITKIVKDEEVYAGEEIEEKFKAMYHKICAAIEKEGYAILDYRMNNDEFSEHCEANDYEFLASGKMY